MQAIDPEASTQSPHISPLDNRVFHVSPQNLAKSCLFYIFPLLPKYFKTVVNIFQVYKRGIFIFQFSTLGYSYLKNVWP